MEEVQFFQCELQLLNDFDFVLRLQASTWQTIICSHSTHLFFLVPSIRRFWRASLSSIL